MSLPAETLVAEVPLSEARRRAALLLSGVSGAEASLDAGVLLEQATGLNRNALLRDGDQLLGPVAAADLAALLRRRLAGEPVWRILGQREFWGLRFAVTPAVLDPRPDTETLVAAALDAVAHRRSTPLRLLDLGVGSGAILGALLSELPHAVGWGVDQSEAAARVARRNIYALGLVDRAGIAVGDWAGAITGSAFDLVVSNPPYIESDVLPSLPPEVRDHDPPIALDGGPDGLACYRPITADLARLLAPEGIAALEVGAGQAPAVQALLEAAGLRVLAVRRDLGGHERAVVATRP